MTNYLFFCFFQKLILSETSIFDVLPNFFYHSNQVVRMAALEVRGMMISIHKAICLDLFKLSTFSVAVSPIATGVRSQSIHRLRAEQCSASTTEGQHLYSRVPVHAAYFTPKQVSHITTIPPLCIIVVSAPTLKGTVTRNFFFFNKFPQYIVICIFILPSETNALVR